MEEIAAVTAAQAGMMRVLMTSSCLDAGPFTTQRKARAGDAQNASSRKVQSSSQSICVISLGQCIETRCS
ncbi:hypothetical protein HS088_TW22G01345 [Tripterygium wilfordii]|uniref:Uncharacterized protein n=1 Tax=Tripterygium wilfordii TaxID=458696 RepID=A0A7J7C0G2_TRIWF|nr:hypothetical protein HS088_TW22G01345 [Tripterygium wilfordii]